MGASPTVNDPASSEHFVVFLPELGLAKIIDHTIFLTNPDRYKFILVPTPSYRKLLGDRAKNDKRYIPRDDCFVIEVPAEYVYFPPSQDPVFFRFGIMTTWEGKFVDFTKGQVEKYMNELQSVKRTRDWYAEALKLKDRQIAKMSAHPEAMETKVLTKYSKAMKDMNPLPPPEQMQGGMQK